MTPVCVFLFVPVQYSKGKRRGVVTAALPGSTSCVGAGDVFGVVKASRRSRAGTEQRSQRNLRWRITRIIARSFIAPRARGLCRQPAFAHLALSVLVTRRDRQS